MNTLLVSIIILLFFIVAIVVVVLRSIQRLPKEITDADYYDDNGNHIYFDRKLIPKEEVEKEPESDNKITDADYYDENGNHIYFDRKLIVWLERNSDLYN